MMQISSKINFRYTFFLVFISLLFFANSNVCAQTQDKFAEAKLVYEQGLALAARDKAELDKKALAKFQKAKQLYSELNNKKGITLATFRVGMILQRLGKFGEALEIYKKVYKPFHEMELKLEEAEALNYMGVIYSYLGQKDFALTAYNAALRIYYDRNEFDRAIPTLNNIGVIYKNQGKKKDAIFYFELALPIVRFEKMQDTEAMILRNLGMVYMKSREYKVAENYFLNALKLLNKPGDEFGQVNTLNALSILAYRTGNRDKSLGYLYRSLIINRSRFKKAEAATHKYLQTVLRENDDKELAIYYGKQAVNNYQEIRRSISKLDSNIQGTFLSSIEGTYRELADLLIEQGDFARAEKVLRMLKEAEYFDFVRRDSDELNDSNTKVELTSKEKELLAKYIELANRLSGIERKKARLEERRAMLTNSEVKRLEDLREQLKNVSFEFQELLSKDFVAAFGKDNKKGIEHDRSLQAKLRKWGNGTVTLYTVVAENRYRVILTTQDKQIAAKTESPVADLNKKIFAYRDALQDITADPRPLGKELYDILIKPIEKDLQEADAKTLVWSLDGTLRYIPIATLSPDGKSYLVEKYRNVIITPKTRDDVSDIDSEWRALGVGVSEPQTVANPENPDEQIDFVAIPGTKQELTTIIRDEERQDKKGILSGRKFIDKEFTIDSLANSLSTKSTDGKRKFTAVHIASHFQLGTNWANSFLLLGNGKILTLEQLKNSPKLDFGDVELITLSACDTAFTADSNGKEVDSLATVIQAKSGKAVLAALWAVADESTPLLMSEFYRLRKENPKTTKAEAMQTVQKAFLNGELKPSPEYTKKLSTYYKTIGASDKVFRFDRNTPFSHPYFWSPFVLIGNWR